MSSSPGKSGSASTVKKFVFPKTTEIARPTTQMRNVVRAKVGGKDFAIVARRGSYRAANNPRSRVQTPYGGSGDQQTDPWSRRIIREFSRDMERNCDTYRILLDNWSHAIAGTGVQVVPTTKDVEWNEIAAAAVDKKFKQVIGGIDSRQRKSWYTLQADFARAVAMDGDAAILKLSNFTVQMVESEQVTSGTSSMGGGPQFYTDGVNLDNAGAAVSYSIAPYDKMIGSLDYGLIDTYGSEYVQFTANVDRFSQTRGMPLLVAGLDDWERIDSYRESEVIAAEQGSLVYGAIEYPEGNYGFGKTYLPGNQAPGGPNDGNAPSAGFNGGFNSDGAVDWHGSNAGYMMELPNGAKYVPVNPQRPNKDAAPFMIELLRQFCANSGLPYEIQFNDLRGLSWSIHRGLVALARDKMRVIQNKLFATPFGDIYLWTLANLIASGEVPANEEWESFDLVWPELSWPDEGKEFEASVLGLSKGLTTRHKIMGPTWRKMLDQQMEELNYAAKLCVKFNEEFAESEDEDTNDADPSVDSDDDGDGVDANGDETSTKTGKSDKSKKVKAAGFPPGKSAKPAKPGAPGEEPAPGQVDPLTGIPVAPQKKNAAGFRITPQELLGYVDWQPNVDPSAPAAHAPPGFPGAGGNEKPGAKKDKSKVGGADELKTPKPRKED